MLSKWKSGAAELTQYSGFHIRRGVYHTTKTHHIHTPIHHATYCSLKMHIWSSYSIRLWVVGLIGACLKNSKAPHYLTPVSGLPRSRLPILNLMSLLYSAYSASQHGSLYNPLQTFLWFLSALVIFFSFSTLNFWPKSDISQQIPVISTYSLPQTFSQILISLILISTLLILLVGMFSISEYF